MVFPISHSLSTDQYHLLQYYTCFCGMIICHKINSFIWWDQNREISSGKMIFLPLLYLLLKAWIIRRRRTMTNFWFITTVKHDVESRPWPSLYYSTSSAFAYYSYNSTLIHASFVWVMYPNYYGILQYKYSVLSFIIWNHWLKNIWITIVSEIFRINVELK